MSQNTSTAVMARRIEPHDSLDYYPTPPWATRALCEWIKDYGGTLRSCIEPACGEGYMARPLSEYFGTVFASDVHAYGYGEVDDFLFPNPAPVMASWVITNPPFRLAKEFIETALPRASVGVAMFCRTVFLESDGRYRDLFAPTPPTDVLVFSERVPLVKGVVDEEASSATSYSWFVWRKHVHDRTRLDWIPPGTRKRLERPEDYEATT